MIGETRPDLVRSSQKPMKTTSTASIETLRGTRSIQLVCSTQTVEASTSVTAAPAPVDPSPS